jgi:hypothetical protein
MDLRRSTSRIGVTCWFSPGVFSLLFGSHRGNCCDFENQGRPPHSPGQPAVGAGPGRMKYWNTGSISFFCSAVNSIGCIGVFFAYRCVPSGGLAHPHRFILPVGFPSGRVYRGQQKYQQAQALHGGGSGTDEISGTSYRQRRSRGYRNGRASYVGNGRRSVFRAVSSLI